jgi:hypothetical protein
MNLAVGFYCPVCGHEEANLLGIDLDEGGFVVGLRLLCASCESVFRENTVNKQPHPIDDLINRGR